MRFIKYFLIFLLFSCKKEKVQETSVSNELKNGILVLNEGLFQLNNSNLSWINLADLTVSSDFFEQKTGRNLGDTGNDLKKYGGKIYIVVNGSSTLEILNAKTGKSIKQISFLNGNQSKQARSITFFQNKAFISCFDGFVDVLDTNSLEIEKRISVGLNPDQIVASNSKIFVSNSGGLNSTLDSTISIIDPISKAEEGKIIVGKNPGQLEIVGNYLFVNVRGNFGSIPSKLKRINLNTLQIEETYSLKPILFEKMNNQLLIAFEENQEVKLGLFDVQSNTWTNQNFIDLTDIQTLYGIHYESTTNKIYLFDAKGYTVSGKILEYTSSGNFIQSFSVGLNPNSMLFF